MRDPHYYTGSDDRDAHAERERCAIHGCEVDTFLLPDGRCVTDCEQCMAEAEAVIAAQQRSA